MKGTLLILSGPSGVGKDTVIDAWQAVNPRVERVVAYTTKRPRPSDLDGRDYHFVDDETFAKMAREGAFLEHKTVHGKSYGTPAAEVEAILARGNIAILKIDVQGARAVMALRPDARSAFILPPSNEELEKRIRGRNEDSEEQILSRLETAKREIERSVHYEHVWVNDEVGEVVRKLEAEFGG